MKRILAMVLFLQVALVSYCHAYVPDPNRWQWFMNSRWYDKQNIEFYLGDSYEHRGHRMVETWILSAPSGKSTYTEGHGVFDLDCQGFWAFSTYVYNANTRERVRVLDDSKTGFHLTRPGTYGMKYIQALEQAWRKDPRNRYRNSPNSSSPSMHRKGRLSDVRS